MNDISRLNVVESYKVLKAAKASEIGNSYELDSTHHNHYFVLVSRVNHDHPRPIRESVFYLKWDLRDTPIYVLQLQSSELKVIKRTREKDRQKEETPSDVD